MVNRSAKDIVVKPISAQDANRFVKAHHYSGKVAAGSQLHLGVFLDGVLLGVMQFGPSINKKGTQRLVQGTGWNGFTELNRMAFADVLPRNSESRALGIAMRTIRKHYPHIEWVISFSDGTQCGDGTIYRASGFYLCGIKKNTTILRMPDGSIVADKTLNDPAYVLKGQSSGYWKKNGAQALPGFQLRYIYFINPEARNRLTVPELPFSKIAEIGATMYRGLRPESIDSDAPDFRSGESGANPTSGLHPKEA
jgi:hypothetical protein